MRKVIAGSALGVAAFGGGIVGAVGLSPITATAQEAVDEVQKPASWFGSILTDLVGEGEITQAQADLIETRVDEARPERTHGHSDYGDHFDRDGQGFDRFRGGMNGSATDLADALNTTPEELFAAIRGGQTIAEIADEQGVSTDELIDILTAESFAAIDEKVASGELDAADAETYKTKATERIQAAIDGDMQEAFGKRGHGRRGHGKSGFGDRFGGAASEDAEIGDA